MKNNLTSHRDHINKKYGEKGSAKREEYQAGFEVFKLGIILQEMRSKNGLTQEQLANKCGTTKS